VALEQFQPEYLEEAVDGVLELERADPLAAELELDPVVRDGVEPAAHAVARLAYEHVGVGLGGRQAAARPATPTPAIT
jgi:hypothetical protein